MLRRASSAVAKLLAHPLAGCRASVLHQQARTTIIFKRMFPVLPPAEKEDQPLRKYKEPQIEDQVLVMVENTEVNNPMGKMEVLLAKDIEGLGMTGEVVQVKKNIAREQLLPMGIAVYASPENLEKYKDANPAQSGQPSRSMSSQRTLSQMRGFTLRVPMSTTIPWTLNKTHVRVAFRKMGVKVKENCIELPSEAIDEPQEIEVQLTLNKRDTFAVKTIVHHYDPNPDATQDFPPPWVGRKKAKFAL